MPVDSTNPQYDDNKDLWAKCRDVIEGEEAIHKGGQTYLPILSGQETSDYNGYRDRALFYNATGRTVDALVGLVFRKDPNVTAPASMDPITENIDLKGTPFETFAQWTVNEIVGVGRTGILVDFPTEQDGVVSQADAQAENRRPFAIPYATESIIDWRSEVVSGATKLTHVRLFEAAEQISEADEFVRESVNTIRVLKFDENGNYVQDVWKEGSGSQWTLEETITPRRNGQPLTSIPFVFIGPLDLQPEVDKPPLLDLVNVNLSHYRNSADIEHGAHFTALPTAVITGHASTDKQASFVIGPSQVWVLPKPDADAKFLEYTGAGLGALENLMDRKEGQMAAIGARMLAPEKRAAEAAETLSIRSAGENAVLSTIALTCSRGLSNVLNLLAEWAGIAGEASVELNTDFVAASMSAQELTALLQAWQSGGMSKETLFENLKQGEIIDAERQFEDEEERIANERSFSGDDDDDSAVD